MSEVVKASASNVNTDSLERYITIGASITQGLHDPAGGWVQRLNAHFTELRIVNPDIAQPTIFPSLGVMGSTVSDLISRMDTDVRPRMNANEDTGIFISAGTNLAAVIDGEPRSSVEAFGDEYDLLLDRALDLTDTLKVVGLTPVDEFRTTPVRWDETLHFTNSRLQIFDDAIRHRCALKGVEYVRVFEPLLRNGAEIFTPIDGLHPGPKGHELIARLVLATFE